MLRHQPEAAGITLDEHGWADVEDLIQGISGTGRPMDMELLEDIVRTDEKGRYSFNEDRTLIRANQGHSIPVDVELTETAPPQVLYHGTASRFEQANSGTGLKAYEPSLCTLVRGCQDSINGGKKAWKSGGI